MIRVYLVRHGQTLWNAEGRYQGKMDSALSPLGRVQADRLARALATAPFAAVYSSPLVRAWDTALVIAALHRLSVVPVEELREIYLGAWEGLTEGEIARRFGDVVVRRQSDPERVVPEGASRSLRCRCGHCGRSRGSSLDTAMGPSRSSPTGP